MSEDRTRNVEPGAVSSRVMYVLAVLCALLVVVDLFYSGAAVFPWQGWLAFYGGFAFAACIVFALLARVMQRLTSRPEDYYDR